MLVTNRADLAAAARSLRNQGRNAMGAWLEHERLGYNYRLNEMSAALGLSQLKRVETFLAKRERVARMYTERLQRFDWVRTPVVKPHVKMSWFVYVIRLAEGLERDAVMQAMEALGVPVRGYFSPIHLQPYIQERLGTRAGLLPVTEAVARHTLALPFHNNLSEAEVEWVVCCLQRAVAQAS